LDELQKRAFENNELPNVQTKANKKIKTQVSRTANPRLVQNWIAGQQPVTAQRKHHNTTAGLARGTIAVHSRCNAGKVYGRIRVRPFAWIEGLKLEPVHAVGPPWIFTSSGGASPVL
jgi:hypothetical protein